MRSGSSRIGCLFGFLTVCGLAFGQSGGEINRAKETYWSFEASTALGQRVLGSEQIRRGGFYAVSLSTDWNGLRYASQDGQFVVRGYYMFSKGSEFRGGPVFNMHTVGLTASARYWNELIKGTDTYLELGWGLAFNNMVTRDLDTRLLSTPVIGLGMVIPGTDAKYSLSVRWFHMSNAGTRGNNQGLNMVHYGLQVRF